MTANKYGGELEGNALDWKQGAAGIPRKNRRLIYSWTQKKLMNPDKLGGIG
jgi:hypothetical protein